ncbi:MAG: phosphate ABC transporter substrate-binding protein [Oceanospirillales bacterium]|nr:phosphate ABC transporter substrate-binding protein [Oceanospirillales bacterium]MBR9887668.1 phosphate ABC transporter substrate-binding protein [Oceanospirillales bacterium]
MFTLCQKGARCFIGSAILGLMATATSVRAESVDIVGTGDGMVIMQGLADAFKKHNSEHTITIPQSVGSSGGIKAVGQGHYLLGRVARTIKDKEKPYGLEYLPIARFPVVFFVNPDVDVTNLSVQQVLDIYSGKITDWKQVGGRDGRVRVVRREDGDSSLNNLRNTLPGFKELVITPLSKTTHLTQETFELIETKSGTIGFGPYSGTLAANVRVLNIDHKKPTDADYPSFGVLALIFKPENRQGVVADFIDFMDSDKAAQAIKDNHATPF